MSSWQIKIWTPTTHVKPQWMLSFINYVKHLYDQFPVAWVASGNTVTPFCWPLPLRRKLWSTIMTMIGLYKHGHDREGAIIWMAQDLLIQNNTFLQLQAFLSFELLFPFVQVMRGKCFYVWAQACNQSGNNVPRRDFNLHDYLDELSVMAHGRGM
jgi:hypothetical protein